MSRRRRKLETDLGTFVRKYERKAQPGSEPNDRQFDRKLQARLRRMDPEELDQLLHDDPDAEAELRAEELALARFLMPSRRDRFRKLLVTERGRAKLRSQLAHFRDLNPKACQRIPSSQQSTAAIEALLVTRGAPPLCVVIAENAALDGHRMSLHQALAGIVGRGSGALVSCVPGTLGYFEGEEPDHRFLLHRATG